LCDQKSIYIHIPFCVKKCVYCDFYSDTQLSLMPQFVVCLQKEIEKRSGLRDKIDTIYFGGGTPSLLLVNDVESLLKTIKDNYIISKNTEVTFEVNPGTLDFDYLKALKDVGINRLSIGVQSFNDNKLKFLKRIHTADQAIKTFEYAKKAGFENISLDLIYGLPFEDEVLWQNDLNRAVNLAPSHLSCYMLTIEPGTPLDEQLQEGSIEPLGNSAISELFKQTSLVLNEHYEHYEISSFAKISKTRSIQSRSTQTKLIQSRPIQSRSRHNSKYWNMTPYLGFGPSAHSYDGTKRFWNKSSIKTYIRDINSGNLPVEDYETLTLEQKMLENIMLKLRTLEGLDTKEFQTRFDISFEDKFKNIIDQIIKQKLGEQKLGSLKNNRFSLTLAGRTHLNGIVEAFADII
jgi:oxygen-independent coproporphyrinogen-3 oxidase